MQVEEIRAIARQRGLKPGKLKKLELIRYLQKEEGNPQCFATAVNGQCDQLDCLWRKDCFAAARKLHS
ncbi:MAG TPA: SAP domain-containing protein [Gammaproteobacteria bacterium]|nr:SAP domain-containing protein [Gammaproteobacteria bacterium]